MADNILLACPDFNKQLKIHTNTSKFQLVSVISQDGKPIAFYSRKLTNPQMRYKVPEREILGIVETLK